MGVDFSRPRIELSLLHTNLCIIMSKYREEWTADEDAKLTELVRNQQHKFGKKDHEAFKANWKDIARCMKTRTDAGCQARWTVHLDPTVDRSPWTPELDKMLLELYHDKVHNSWSKRAKVLALGKVTADGYPMRRGGGDTCDRYFFLKKQAKKAGVKEEAVDNSGTVVKTEATEVKLEGGIKREVEEETPAEESSSSSKVTKKKAKKSI